jgi:Uma2 family endonuclease
MVISSSLFKNFKTRPFSGKVYFTYDNIKDLPEFPEGPLVELIQGDLYVVPSPTPRHQEISQNLAILLGNHIRAKNLGKLYSVPIDVLFSEEDLTVPDLLFIETSNLGIVKEKCIEGSPNLIIEILSSNRQTDLQYKLKLYEMYGVEE